MALVARLFNRAHWVVIQRIKLSESLFLSFIQWKRQRQIPGREKLPSLTNFDVYHRRLKLARASFKSYITPNLQLNLLYRHISNSFVIAANAQQLDRKVFTLWIFVRRTRAPERRFRKRRLIIVRVVSKWNRCLSLPLHFRLVWRRKNYKNVPAFPMLTTGFFNSHDSLN